jgi:hypothetical protein
MAGTRSQGSSRRFFLYALAAVPIAAVIFALATALGSAPAPKVAFDIKLKIAGQDVRASGTTFLRSDGFSFAAGRLSFTGTVTGDDVSIAGKVATDDRAQTRDFGASGHLAEGRMSATLNGDGGRRMGTLKLELINR